MKICNQRLVIIPKSLYIHKLTIYIRVIYINTLDLIKHIYLSEFYYNLSSLDVGLPIIYVKLKMD